MASSGEHLWPDYHPWTWWVWGERCCSPALSPEGASPWLAGSLSLRRTGPCLRDLVGAPPQQEQLWGLQHQAVPRGKLPCTPSAAIPVARTSPTACSSPTGGWRC